MNFIKLRGEDGQWHDVFVLNGEIMLPIAVGDGADSLLMAGAKSAFADYGVAIGPDCAVGRKGYYIKSIDAAAQKIYLSAEKVEAPEMTDTDNADAAFPTPGYAAGDWISIINGSHYYYCATIANIENNVITYEGELGFKAFAEDAAQDGHSLYVPSKPEVGAAVFGVGGFAAGEGCKAGGRGVLAGGRDNEGANYATVGGRSNQAGYGVGLFGTFNFVPGLGSIGGGSWNEILARYCGFSGTYNKIEKAADFSRIYGTGNTIGTAHTHGGGQGSASRGGRMNTFHGENLDITGSFNDVEGRGHRVHGDFNFVRGDNLIAVGNQAVLGTYNIEDPDKLLIIGGGTARERKNIFTIDRDGNVNGTNMEALQSEITALHEKAAALSDFAVYEMMEGLTERLTIAPRFSFFGNYFRVLADGEPMEDEYKAVGEPFQTAHGVLWADNVQIALYDAEKTETMRCRLQMEHADEHISYGHLVKEG